MDHQSRHQPRSMISWRAIDANNGVFRGLRKVRERHRSLCRAAQADRRSGRADVDKNYTETSRLGSRPARSHTTINRRGLPHCAWTRLAGPEIPQLSASKILQLRPIQDTCESLIGVDTLSSMFPYTIGPTIQGVIELRWIASLPTFPEEWGGATVTVRSAMRLLQSSR